MVLTFVALALFLDRAPGAYAADPSVTKEPPAQPFLRIETGMHTATINRIAVDKRGWYLVTCSNDKTVRIWDAHFGLLLRTLRPPISDDEEGAIFAVAITPDGKTIACGGWTGYAWDQKNCIYLFDTESGALIRRIPGLPSMPQELAFSPDGQLLAAGLSSGGGGGVRLFRASDGLLVGQDTDYKDQCYGVDFDSAGGRLVATSYDGLIRLYKISNPGGLALNALQLVTKAKAPEAKPFGGRFSPDGTRIAVGYKNVARVSVLSAADLTLQFSPDTTGIPGGNLHSVCWAPDGSLYAGGTYLGPSDNYLVRRWSGGGTGAYVDLVATGDNVRDLRASSDGRIFFGGADPCFGAFSSAGKRILFTPKPIAAYRGNREHFNVSKTDAGNVRFPFLSNGGMPVLFSLASRSLTTAPRPGSIAALTLPLAPNGSLAITDWKYSAAPKLNGAALPIQTNEMSWCLATAPDNKSFVLGADWDLFCFDSAGKKRWRASSSDVVWAVNIADEGRVVVAAFGDGTIHWYRMADGAELLTFFAHADRKRWIVWTPQGYYDCSPGGEDLIGWHLNRGKEQAADFFPASQFRERFYRPDVVRRVLQQRDVTEALRLANTDRGMTNNGSDDPTPAVTQALPPVVRILSPESGAAISADSIVVRVAVRTPADAPVTVLRALVDGRPAASARGQDFSHATVTAVGDGLQTGESAYTLSVPLPARDCQIAIVAQNKNAVSVADVRRLVWHSAPDTEAVIFKPKLYVLAIGVGKYALTGHDLVFPAKDAHDFAETVKAQSGGLYRAVEVKVITDAAATRDDVVDGLEWIQRETTSRDVAMVFLSGHGDNDPDGNYYFLPHNFDGERWKRTAVSYADIQSTLKDIKGKALFFLDTCHSGNVDGSGTRRKGISLDVNRLVNDLTSAANGVVVFAASTGQQSALEDDSWGNGAFTLALIEALKGRQRGSVPLGPDAGAALDMIRKTGKATITSLDAYLAERVKQLTGGRQTPTTTKPTTVPDFPVAAIP